MRTLRRRRDRARSSQLTVTVALPRGDAVRPGDIVMLEDLGPCLVLVVRDPDGTEHGLQPGDRAVVMDVEAFAPDNVAPDLP